MARAALAQLLAQISTYIIVASLVSLLASLLDAQALRPVRSLLLPMQCLAASAVLAVPSCCPPFAYAFLVLKVALIAVTCWSGVDTSLWRGALAIGISGIYAAAVNLDFAYGCSVTPGALGRVAVITSLVYGTIHLLAPRPRAPAPPPPAPRAPHLMRPCRRVPRPPPDPT